MSECAQSVPMLPRLRLIVRMLLARNAMPSACIIRRAILQKQEDLLGRNRIKSTSVTYGQPNNRFEVIRINAVESGWETFVFTVVVFLDGGDVEYFRAAHCGRMWSSALHAVLRRDLLGPPAARRLMPAGRHLLTYRRPAARCPAASPASSRSLGAARSSELRGPYPIGTASARPPSLPSPSHPHHTPT